ncbi:alpha/beta fold hydrolase [Dyella sp. A6]|uniref:alpha/beta fold hydrolase n=1 Tax=Dyella aluminiiresistens TaxID=3069105 RepID=UPI002E79D2A5|nr:alpha/beta fold hydrolase [Dyella sp. A6]
MSATHPPQRPLWQRMLLRRLKFLAVVAVLLALLLGGSYLFAPRLLMRADTARKAMAAHLEEKSIQAGDTRWSYYEGGTGPTIVLLHGFDSDKQVWLPVAQLLTPHFHLIIPDLPGWGRSSRIPDGNYDIDAQAARLQAFMQALGVGQVLLVGHSMGGAIAGVYAAEHPAHVDGLALLDSFGLKSRENAFDKAALAGQDPFAYTDRAGFERALALAFDTPPHIPGRFVDALVKQNTQRHAFIQRTFDALRQPDQALSLQNRLGQLTMPVLGLWCHDDRIVDISAMDSLRSGLTHASAISSTMLIGCGHMPMLEKPQETAQALTAFALSH